MLSFSITSTLGSGVAVLSNGEGDPARGVWGGHWLAAFADTIESSSSSFTPLIYQFKQNHLQNYQTICNRLSVWHTGSPKYELCIFRKIIIKQIINLPIITGTGDRTAGVGVGVGEWDWSPVAPVSEGACGSSWSSSLLDWSGWTTN
jgi:hypothetical protein